MSRVVLPRGEQAGFLRRVRAALGATWGELAQLVRAHPRTLRDWAGEKWQMSFEAARELERRSGIPLPSEVRVLSEFWSTSKAAAARNRKWGAVLGNPGTPDGRRKGGLISQQRRQEEPRRYAEGLIGQRKAITVPLEGEELAEFIGIVLGDGTISRHQVRIALNRTTDRAYGEIVAERAEGLFRIRVAKSEPAGGNTLYLKLTGINLVEFLVPKGLCRGHKVRQQVGIPEWIRKDPGLARACVRGLVDTDGSIYRHSHRVKGRQYANIGLGFRSYSLPLLGFVHEVLCEAGLPAKNDNRGQVSLYGRTAIGRYLEAIGTRNPKHSRKFAEFVGRGDRAAEGAALEMPCTG